MRAAAALALLALAAACGSDAEPLTVSDAWVREPPAGAGMTAGYLALHNAGDETVTLTAAESPAFAAIELHETVLAEGRARMRPVTRVALAPGDTLRLAPGGLHLMLFTPAGPLEAGGEVPLTLVFAGGGRLEIVAEVRRGAAVR